MSFPVKYDVRASRILLSDGTELGLTPAEAAIFFWWTTGAPMARLADLTGTDLQVLDQDGRALSERLGLADSDVAALDVEYIHGKAPKPGAPWPDRTLARYIDDNLNRRDPAETYMEVSGSGAVSVGELQHLLANIRAGLRQAGVGPGDIVAADSTLRLETYLLSFAAWLHGAAILRLSSSAPTSVIRAQLDRTPAAITFTTRTEDLQGAAGVGQLIALPDDLKDGQDSGFEDWLAAAPDPVSADRTPAAVDPTDLCVVSLTSGTTGAPKAVLLSHASIWWGADRASRFTDFSSDDVFASATDFIGDMSSNVALFLPLAHGAKIVLPRPVSRGSPVDYAIDCMNAKVTAAMLVPSALRTLLAAGEQVTRPFAENLKYLITASAPFGEPMAKAFRRHSAAQIVEYMGAREYGGALTALTRGTKVISAGGGFENEALIRIIRPDGSLTDIGETGTLMIVSAGIMEGYVREAGREKNGYAHLDPRPEGYALWYDTGDLASYCEDGGIELRGRSHELMKTPDGQIVMPIEIENVLHACPDVREACVFSVRDADGFERIGAAVLPIATPAPDDLENRLRQTVNDALGHLRTPAAIMIRDAFPRVAQNKVNKTQLKALFLENALLNLETTTHARRAQV